jgi:hypothetical protein
MGVGGTVGWGEVVGSGQVASGVVGVVVLGGWGWAVVVGFGGLGGEGVVRLWALLRWWAGWSNGGRGADVGENPKSCESFLMSMRINGNQDN